MAKYIFLLFKTFLIAIFALLLLYPLLTGKTYLYKAVYYNFVNIDDYKIFSTRTIPVSTAPQPWPISKKYNQIVLNHSFSDSLQKLKTVALLVIKNDSIIYEKYSGGYSEKSLSNAFSMAKSVISLLVGAAIKDGHIASVNQPVADFLPEFKDSLKSKITIKHLLQMSSGLDFDESTGYRNPVSVFFSDIMVAYYGNDLYNLVAHKKAVETPGVYFDYKSGDTQLLAFIVMKATGKSISEYYYEKIAQPLGMETAALWMLDKENGYEKSYCCLNSNARDFAKIVKLMLNYGNAGGVQIADTNYIVESLSPSLLQDKNHGTGKTRFYGYQWWLLPHISPKAFYMRGTLGQIVVAVPEKNIIFVRLGESQGKSTGLHYGLVDFIWNELKTVLNL